MHRHGSHSEWIIARSVQIDESFTGFCGGFLRASPERRQVIAAYLATRRITENQNAEVGRFLLHADHRSILSEAFDTVPNGLRGALRRAGPTAHLRPFYRLLHDLLSEPHHDEVVRCVANLAALDIERLRIIRLLPAPICRANVVVAMGNSADARDAGTAMRLLNSRGVAYDPLVQSIRQVRNAKGLSKAFRRAMLSARAPAHPIPASDCYSPIRSGEELHSVSRKFQNCLRSYTTRFMDDHEGHAFAVARHGDAMGVVHLIRDGEGWKLEGMFGPRNVRPSPPFRERIATYLAQHGVNVENPFRHKPSEWDAVRRLTAHYLEGFDFD